ncbi:MAG: NAD-dependent epimerase/dehydratase family protein [Rhodospirillales bacterium]
MTSQERVLVTGGAGFIGSHVVNRLHAEGHRVRVLEKPGTSTAHLPQQDVDVVFADLSYDDVLSDIADGCDVVLHLAANPNLWSANPEEFEQINHQGTRRVIAAACRAGARNIVHVSTESILCPADFNGVINEKTETTLDDMIGDYCRSKWLAERAAFEAAEAGAPVVVVRPSVPVGPGDHRMGPFTRMVRDFAHGRIKAYLGGNLNFIDVRDVADGIWAAARQGVPGQPYLLVSENWTIVEVLKYLSELTGHPAPRYQIPYSVALLFAYLEEGFSGVFAPNRTPMATVTGVKLTRRSFRFDGEQSAGNLGLPARRDCRQAIVDLVDFLRSKGQIPVPARPEADA